MTTERRRVERYREESLFLLAVSRAGSVGDTPEAVAAGAAPLVTGSFDWGKYITLARRQNALAAAYRLAADTGLDAQVPEDTLRIMKLGYVLAQATYVKNLIELRELSEALKRDRVPFVVIKGIPLAQRIYTEPSVRVSRDLDILCKMEDLERVERVLEGHGYSIYVGKIGADGYRRHHYHFVYGRGVENESVVEVHWNVRHPGRGAPIDIDPLFQNTVKVDAAGTEIAALDDTRALWQLAVNASYTGFLDARDLGDLRRLSRRLGGGDWDALIGYAHNTGTFNEFSTALAVSERVFGPFIPESHRSATRPGAILRAFLLPPYSPRALAWRWLPFRGAQSLSVDLFMRKGLAKKLGFLYRILIPDEASLIETRCGRPAPRRWKEKLKLYSNGAWIAAKVAGVSALLGPMASVGFLADGWADPERHVDLNASSRGADSRSSVRGADSRSTSSNVDPSDSSHRV
jgi:hypothetical protein